MDMSLLEAADVAIAPPQLAALLPPSKARAASSPEELPEFALRLVRDLAETTDPEDNWLRR